MKPIGRRTSRRSLALSALSVIGLLLGGGCRSRAALKTDPAASAAPAPGASPKVAETTVIRFANMGEATFPLNPGHGLVIPPAATSPTLSC